MIRGQPITGRDISIALYARLRRPLKEIWIVTPFLQDYEFFRRSPLSTLLTKQLAEGVKVVLLTMPPEGTNGTRRAFSRKYTLLRRLAHQGAQIWLNRQLHAKVFMFDESQAIRACILGSANLTTAAMNERLEIALLSFNQQLYHDVMRIIRGFLIDSRTKSFFTWRVSKAAEIKRILGEV